MKSIFKPSFSNVFAACALAFGLVACGGGGGGTSSPVSTSVLPTISVNIPVAPYATGTAERGAYNVLQSARVLCGFGTLQQSTQLDAASQAHAKYLVDLSLLTGTSVISHSETSGVSGFTGVDLGARALNQGYVYGALAEILEATSWDYRAQQNLPTLEARGASSILNLMNTVYHLSGAMYEGRDVGLGSYLGTKQTSSTNWHEEYRFGALIGYRHSASPWVMGANVVATYPCAGSTNIPPSFAPANESPNPFPSYTSSSQLVGPPIYVKVDDGQNLVLTSYSVRLKNGAAVTTVLIDYNYDQLVAKEVRPNESFVVPNVALIPSATYQVTLNGTIDGRPFPTRSFEFSTGS